MREGLRAKNSKIPEKELEIIMANADVNGDGKVDYDVRLRSIAGCQWAMPSVCVALLYMCASSAMQSHVQCQRASLWHAECRPAYSLFLPLK